MNRHRAMPGVFGPGYANARARSEPPSSSSPKHHPPEGLQGWLWLPEGLLQEVAGQLSTVKIPGIEWMSTHIHPSINSPLMPVGLGFSLFVIPLVISLIVHAIQLTLLGVAAAHFVPRILDGIVSLEQQQKSEKSEKPENSKTDTTPRMLMAGIAGVLAIGYSIGTITSLVILASSAYGYLGRQNTEGGQSQREVAAQGMPAKTAQCPFRRTTRHWKSAVGLVSGRQ